MSEYRLAGSGIITDEEIELECAEYEAGTWEGRLMQPMLRLAAFFANG